MAAMHAKRNMDIDTCRIVHIFMITRQAGIEQWIA
jgi:hypothetical protein